MVVGEDTFKLIISKDVKDLKQKYHEKFGENPPPFNYFQYENGEDMVAKLTEAIQTGKPLIPKKELSMFDL